MAPSFAFLVQALVVIGFPFALWRWGRVGAAVPLVVVQILTGIALGPTGLGQAAPALEHLLFGPETLAPLSGIASIAVLFFGFITGLHLDPAEFQGRGRAFVLVGIGSVVVPTMLGVAAGFQLAASYPELVGPHTDIPGFALAIGICAGVTALPVLGAVLREMGLLGSRLGHVALGLAALNDGALWLLLAALLATSAGNPGGSSGLGALGILVLGPLYLLAMIRLVRPLLDRLRAPETAVEAATRPLGDGALVAICAVAIGSAAVTELLGLHYILGAFVAGAVMPHHLRQAVLDRVQTMTVIVLLPFFFMLTGLKTRIDPDSGAFVTVFLLTTAVSMAGKILGTALPARLIAGESWPVALTLGTLMQTKGLMEVIVLTILLDLGVITAPVFSALVLMAVVTTALAMPLARLARSEPARAAGH